VKSIKAALQNLRELAGEATPAPVPARPTPVAQASVQRAQPVTQAPLAIRKQILAHQKQMGVDPREYVDLEQSIIAEERAQAAPKKLLSAEQEAALMGMAQQFIRKSEEARAVIQKRFANAQTIRQMGDGRWMVSLPGGLVKTIDPAGINVLKTISKGRVYPGDWNPAPEQKQKVASEAETAEEAAEALT
jgi:hypothetical protein